MQSFTDHLRAKHVSNLAETAFVLMAQRGVNPVKFVEWFATEGHLFNEFDAPIQTQQWLRTELILSESWGTAAKGALGTVLGGGLGMLAAGPAGAAFGGAIGGGIGTKVGADHDAWKAQPAQSPAVVGAQQALDALSRSLPKSFQDKPNFVQSLHAVIASLKQPHQPMPTPQAQAQPAPAGAAPGTAAPPAADPATASGAPAATKPWWKFWGGKTAPTASSAPGSTVVAHYNPQDDFLGKMIFERRVRAACHKLIEHNVDPRHFANWYITEGRFLKTDEQFQEGIGDFFAQVGSGIGSWAGGHGFQKGYNDEKLRRQTQREREAVGAATHALQQLKEFIPHVPKDANGGTFGGPDIMKHIDLMLKELTADQEQQKKVEPAPEGSEGAATAPGAEAGAGEQGEAVKQELQTAGIDVTHLTPTMLTKYAQELAAVTDPTQRAAKIEELKKLVPADLAIDGVNRNDTGDMEKADIDAIKGILAGGEDDNAKRQKVAEYIAQKKAAPAPAPTDPSMEPTGEHFDLMRSLSAYNKRPKSWFN